LHAKSENNVTAQTETANYTVGIPAVELQVSQASRAWLGRPGDNPAISTNRGCRTKQQQQPQQTAILPRLIHAGVVADSIGKSPKTVYKMAQRRQLPSVKFGSNVMFDPEEINQWIDDHRIAA
jgi:predicted DNA-binding transcriptional regulator AlpA